VSAAPTPSEGPPAADRKAVISRADLAPAALREALWHAASTTIARLGDAHLPPGWAVVGLAGTAKRQICPGSDLDLLLLHPDRVPEGEVSRVAEALWYPLWDAGWKMTPLVHSPASLRALTGRDLVSATSLLDTVHLAGDAAMSDAVAAVCAAQWRKAGEQRLREVHASVRERHAGHGEVAFLLEPDLKEGQGGLRDLHALDWALATDRPDTLEALEVPRDDLRADELLLLDVRTMLHRVTGRPQERLLLQDQATVAEALGIDDDELMRRVSAAGREIQWVTERFWDTVSSRSTGGRRRAKPVKLGPHIELRGSRVSFSGGGGRAGAVEMLRVAAVAAQSQASIDRAALERFAEEVQPVSGVWPPAARQALLTLFGSGRSAIDVIEALDRYRLFERILPEWAAVRCKPQRNAYHRFTVDRHLCEATANAAALVRTVHRPDLLLIGALLHDIGKGYPGDHTVVGMELVGRIGERLGFDHADVAVLVAMVEHHLLLPEVATRRDLSDPATIESVAQAVGTVEVLELLGALTEADSMATGPTAWSEWKRRLVGQLVAAVRAHLVGATPPPALEEFPGPEHLALLDDVRADGTLRVVPRGDRCIVAAPDRTGLLATVAGAMAAHGVEVLSASGWSSDDGLAVEEYRIERRLGGDPSWKRIETDLVKALAGEVDLGQKLRERARTYAGTTKRVSAAPSAPPAVLVDRAASSTATLIEVRAPDRVGVLHDVADEIASAGLDIRVALVETLGHEVVDVFYVRGPDGDPVVGDEVLGSLRSAILARLT
jgi:[protein-PII] uridylyltransferase